MELLGNRDFIQALLAGGAPAAARALRISTRTLRRRLSAEETSVRALVRSARRKALRDLVLDAVAAGEIARELGFATVQSLNRFARREFGLAIASLRSHLLAVGPEVPLINVAKPRDRKSA